MNGTTVDNSYEGCRCAVRVTLEILPLSYNSRYQGREDGRLGADLTSS
jgi:hypothetical protein